MGNNFESILYLHRTDPNTRIFKIHKQTELIGFCRNFFSCSSTARSIAATAIELRTGTRALCVPTYIPTYVFSTAFFFFHYSSRRIYIYIASILCTYILFFLSHS